MILLQDCESSTHYTAKPYTANQPCAQEEIVNLPTLRLVRMGGVAGVAVPFCEAACAAGLAGLVGLAGAAGVLGIGKAAGVLGTARDGDARVAGMRDTAGVCPDVPDLSLSGVAGAACAPDEGALEQAPAELPGVASQGPELLPTMLRHVPCTLCSPSCSPQLLSRLACQGPMCKGLPSPPCSLMPW